jgi:hypothetical protein
MTNIAAANVDGRLTGAERFWYILWCVVTLGWPYFMKVMIKKAVMEALEAQRLAAAVLPPPQPQGPAPAR